MTRRGFTLTEMLVATIVFLVGFVAVFGLFLGGMRFRKLSEDTTRASLTASCIVDEIRSAAGGGSATAAKQPSDYVGDGFADNGPEGAINSSALTDKLYPYPSIPGTWYRVISSTDLSGGNDPNTTVIHLKLVVVPFATTDSTLDFDTLNRRLGLKKATQPQAITELLNRGIGFQYQAVITRRPSWLP